MRVEIEKIRQRNRTNERNTAIQDHGEGQVRQFILDVVNGSEKLNNLYRKHLPSESLASARYKQNYQREYAQYDDSEILADGLNKFAAKPEEVIYRVKLGV